jgi:hypothetical protein
MQKLQAVYEVTFLPIDLLRRIPDTAVSGTNLNPEIRQDMAQASLSCPSGNSPSVPDEFLFSACKRASAASALPQAAF